MNDDSALYAVKPVLMERRCGGWLAVTPRGWPLSLGVTAPSSDKAVTEFHAALDRWARISETGGNEEETEETRG